MGNTPLIRLRSFSELTGCEILAKAEFTNPGGSIKDRAAVSMIRNAEQTGELVPGGTIVDASAGNTGIGLTIFGQARGYNTVIVVPETQSPEKIHLLRSLGARVVLVPERPWDDPQNYSQVAERLAWKNGWFWANQFDNTANRLAHYRGTGPEIWNQTRGEVTGFVSAVGTGGTLAGTVSFLKEQNPRIVSVCADPYGAAMWSWFTRGQVELSEGDSYAEGIGQTRVTGNLKGIDVDVAYRIPDQEAITLIHHLWREQGLCLGLSSGVNLAGALRLARAGGPGQTIVTAFCDSGLKYRSRIFNRRWLAAHQLDADQPLELVLSVN